MDLYESLSLVIDGQFSINKNKNLFHQEGNLLAFSAQTRETLRHFRKQLQLLDTAEVEALLYAAVAGFKQSFFSVNQYIYFTKQDEKHIRQIYLTLLQDLRSNAAIEIIEEQHYNRIAAFIAQTNPVIAKANRNQEEYAISPHCAQYSPKLQLQVLGITDGKLAEPILDIGCGKNAALVKHLRKNGIEAYGIDRQCENTATTTQANWLEYDFGSGKWCTILSHLSFTSHFLHHLVNGNELSKEYLKTYLAVLEALKAEGKFIYAPSLPFIEEVLPEGRFSVAHRDIDGTYSNTIITKN